MNLNLELQINGRMASVEATEPAALSDIVTLLGLRDDRIAIELNGAIVPRTAWPETMVASRDRLEIVHFVGGGKESR